MPTAMSIACQCLPLVEGYMLKTLQDMYIHQFGGHEKI